MLSIKATVKRTVSEDVVVDISNHTFIPFWLAEKIGVECEHCRWEFNDNDQIEAIKLASGKLVVMHSNCFIKAVNETALSK